jgi:hypothetical protein
MQRSPITPIVLATLVAALIASLLAFTVTRSLRGDQEPGPLVPVALETPSTFTAPITSTTEVAPPEPASPPAMSLAVEPRPAPEAAVSIDWTTQAEDFATAFGTAHTTSDIDHLLATLHPVVFTTFGYDTCSDYVASTMGSIRDLRVLLVGEPTSYELTSPGGPVLFDDAIAVFGEWYVSSSGERQSFEFHLVPTAVGLAWLTTCGQSKVASA